MGDCGEFARLRVVPAPVSKVQRSRGCDILQRIRTVLIGMQQSRAEPPLGRRLHQRYRSQLQ
jgi:hypothetical protein